MFTKIILVIFLAVFISKSIQQNEICHGKDSSRFYPNQTDCTRFYRCVNGMKSIDDDISNPQDITKSDNQQFSIHKDNNDTENDKIPSTKEHEDRLKLSNDHDDDKKASGDDATLTTDNDGNDDAVNEAENDNGYDTNDQSQDEGIIGVENDEEDDKMDGSGDEDDKEEKVEQDEEENLNVGDENEEEQKSSSEHDENEEVEEEMESGNAGASAFNYIRPSSFSPSPLDETMPTFSN
ncbi:hypothetical protein ACKWTF_014296 [Chironomus riparius]